MTRASEVQFNGERPDELFVATEPVVGEKVAEDLRNVGYVRSVCEAQEEGQPMRCHLLLHSEEVMDMIVKGDLCDDMNGMAEFHFFTEADMLARKIFVPLPGDEVICPPSDRGLISVDSPKTVHLVLFGLNGLSCSLAKYAAH